jgi:type II secretory pathway component PulF
MPRFVYRAKQGPARTVTGVMDAESREVVLTRLDAMGLSAVSVEAQENRPGFAGGHWRVRRVRGSEITLFSRQLASLIRSGVPILRALSTIREQTESTTFADVVRDLEDTIRDGQMLSGALARHPDLFPELYVNMVRSGESGGVLDTILYRLAESREQDEEMRRKVESALAYPILIVVVGLVTVAVLLGFFLPRVAGLFRDYTQLPLVTRMLIAAGDFVHHYWYWLVFAVVLVLAVFKRLSAMEKGRLFVDRLKLGVPLLGRCLLQAETARFARTLALLIDAGIPIDRALALSGATLRNAVLQEEIEQVRQSTVRQGDTVSAGLKRSRSFPVFVANMAAVGEEGGKLDEALVEVAGFYEHQVDQFTRLVTSLIEPVLILVVGVLVGFIVAAMLLPIFKLSTGL